MKKCEQKSLNDYITYCFFRLLQERDIIVYCDLHGHSRQQNVFIYGCEQHRGSSKRFHERVFPSMLSKNTPEKVKKENPPKNPFYVRIIECHHTCSMKQHNGLHSGYETYSVAVWEKFLLVRFLLSVIVSCDKKDLLPDSVFHKVVFAPKMWITKRNLDSQGGTKSFIVSVFERLTKKPTKLFWWSRNICCLWQSVLSCDV